LASENFWLYLSIDIKTDHFPQLGRKQIAEIDKALPRSSEYLFQGIHFSNFDILPAAPGTAVHAYGRIGQRAPLCDTRSPVDGYSFRCLHKRIYHMFAAYRTYDRISFDLENQLASSHIPCIHHYSVWYRDAHYDRRYTVFRPLPLADHNISTRLDGSAFIRHTDDIQHLVVLSIYDIVRIIDDRIDIFYILFE
jgi:hypothetical protein